jgi:hypothetical protein
MRGKASDTPDPGVAAFMSGFGDLHQDQISGVCTFAEQWVQKVLEPEVTQYTWGDIQTFDIISWAQQPAVRHCS